jgi:simple sugar transport system permease protein
MKRLFKNKEMGLILLALVLIVIITSVNPSFILPSNIMNVLKGNVIMAIVSVGMLLVMITGGIDTSVGGMIAATTLIVGNFMVAVTGNPLIAYLLGIVSGTLIGILNGLLIAYIKIPPIVATLGMYSVLSGTMIYITKGAYVNNLPQEFIDFGKTTFLNIFPNGDGGTLGIPIQLVFLVFVIILTWFIMKYTKVGRGIFAIGSNAVSAERLGYNVKKILIFVYGYMGFICGIAAVTHVSIMRQVDPNAFNGYEMKVIAAVILGGVNIMGGEGSMLGTMMGVLLFAVINNGLTLMHVSTYWQKIILGAIMVISICFVVIQKNRARKKLVKVDIA